MILIDKECFKNNVYENKDSKLYEWYKDIMADKIIKKYITKGKPSKYASNRTREFYKKNQKYIENNIIPFLEKENGGIDKKLVDILIVGDFVGDLANLLEEHTNGEINELWIKIIAYYALAKFVFYDLKKIKVKIIEIAKRNNLNREKCIDLIESILTNEIKDLNSKHIKFKIVPEVPEIKYESMEKWNRDKFIIKSIRFVETIMGIELQENMKFYSNSSGNINKLFDINNFNEMLKYFICYEMLEDEQRHIILNTLNVTVCPYCNRQYITSYKPSENKKNKIDILATADLDHFYPKSEFQLFSLSLYNFVPACQICNSRMKLDRPIEILYPYEECFGDEVKFEVVPIDKKNESKTLFDLLYGKNDILKSEKYKININTTRINSELKKSHVEGSIEMFQLEQVYQSHKEYAAEIIRTQALYDTPVYESIINTLFNNGERSINVNTIVSHLEENQYEGVSENEKKRILYGVNIDDKNQELNVPLIKLTRDILNQ
ncbi:hypothetical protein [Clostridium saccharoperbutylacetonicum]